MYSKLWREITKDYFSGNNISEHTLDNFREVGELNSRLAAWDPMEKSSRYFKSALYSAVKNKPELFFKTYRKVENTRVGNPLDICVNETKINIDYFFSVEEILFLQDNLNISKINSIVEIGAGFGRTCHTLLTLYPNIRKYVIVDLPEVLNLSRIYLKRVLPNQFNLIEFIDCTTYGGGINSDLVINIDSFQEMERGTIDYYFQSIIMNSKYFFCKQPVGKYNPEIVGLVKIKRDILSDVYKLGYCNDVIDIFDSSAIANAAEIYRNKYLPKGNWFIVNFANCSIFDYYQMVLFKNKTREMDYSNG